MPEINHPYNILASLYDQIMAEIDYDFWADYLDGIIQEFAPSSIKLLELGGGTGNLSMSLNELECYEICCSDISMSMIETATQKKSLGKQIIYRQFDARDFKTDIQFDTIFCVFDSLNYLTTLSEIKACFKHVHKALKNNGLWIFDFVTSKHCLENAQDFSLEESFYDEYRVIREAYYPTEEGLHRTQFKVYKGHNTLDCFARETHLQRPYKFEELKVLLTESDFVIEGAFSDFSDQFYGNESKRITIAARCLKNM